MPSVNVILWEKRRERRKERCWKEELVPDVSLAVVLCLKTELVLEEACHCGSA